MKKVKAAMTPESGGKWGGVSRNDARGDMVTTVRNFSAIGRRGR